MPRLPLVLSALVYLLAIVAPAAAAGDDPLQALLEGEFALQEGRFDTAAEAYVVAAETSDDPQLAERAARVALLAKNEALAERAMRRWRTLAPDSGAARQLGAVLALRGGDVESAAGALAELIADGDDGWKLALQALAGERQSAAAAAVLTALVERDALPAALEPQLGFGGLAQRMMLPAVALSVAERITQRHPQAPRGWLWRAELERQQGAQSEALATLRRAVLLPGLDTPLRLAAAAQFDALGEPAAAAEVLAQGEQDDTLLANRAAYLARAEATDALQALYEEVLAGAEPHPPARLFLLGQLAELRKQPQEALGWYGRIRDDPLADDAVLRIAVVRHGLGELDAAIAGLRAFQESDSEDGEALVQSFLLEADLLQRSRKPEAMIEVYDRGLAMFEDEPDLLYGRALAHERVDQVDQAIADLRRLLELEPDNVEAMNALGYTLADRTDQHEEALALITRALEAKPDNPAIVDSMGWVLFRLGRLEEALVHLRRAFELQRDPEVGAHLGEVLWVSGEQEEARSVWRLAEEIDASNRTLRRTRERLDP